MTAAPSPEPQPDEQTLLQQCLDRSEAEQLEELERLCREHPRAAEGLRRRYAALARHGLVSLPLAPGMRLGAYRLLEELGRGGMGIVYLAEHSELHRRVALKLLSPALLGSAQAMARFQREIAALAQLDHPGICAIYEAGVVHGQPFLAMRHVAGRTLADELQAARVTGHLPPIAAAVDWLAQVAEAISAAHRLGFVHRDLKPANIVLASEGPPVVLDFGLARQLASDEPALTASHDPVGTPFYMAPEQVRGGLIGTFTDVHALGAVLFETLTLTPPFAGAQREAVFAAITGEEAPRLRTRRRDASRDLDLVVAACLDKDPRRRYADAGGLARDLRRVLAHEPIGARPLPLWLRVWRWSQRNRLAAATLVFFSVLSLVTCLFVWRLADARRLTRSTALLLASAHRAKDPQLSGLLALAASRLGTNVDAVSHLQRALAELHEEWVWRHPAESSFLLADATRDRCLWLGGRRQVVVGDSATGFTPRLLAHVEYPLLGALAGDGKVAVSSRGEELGELLTVFAADGEPLLRSRLGPPGDWVHSITWLDDDRLLVTRPHTAEVWHVKDCTVLDVDWPFGTRLESEQVVGGVSADRRTLLIATPDQAFVFDLRAGLPEFRQVLPGAGGPRPIFALSEDGGTLLLAATNQLARKTFLFAAPPDSVRLWRRQASRFEHAATLSGFDGEILDLGVTPDGSRLAVSTMHGAVRIFDGEGRLIRERTMEAGTAATDLDFASAGDRLAVVSISGMIHVFDRDGTPLQVLATRRSFEARFTPCGEALLSGGMDCLARHRFQSSDLPILRDAHGPLYFAAPLADGRIVTCSKGGTAVVWRDSEVQFVLRDPEIEAGWVFHACPGPEQGYYTGSQDCRVRRFDAKGRLLARSPHLGCFVSRVLPLSDGRLAAIVNRAQLEPSDSVLVLSADLKDVQSLAATAPPWGGSLSANGRLLATIGVESHTIEILDLKHGTVVWTSPDLQSSWSTYSCALSPDGEVVAAGTADGVVHRFLWRSSTHTQWQAHTEPVLDLEIAADGRIASASVDQTAAVWTPTGRCLNRLRGHSGAVWSSRFTADGRLVTGSEDGTARLWILDATRVFALARQHLRADDRRPELAEYAELVGDLLDRQH